MGFCSGVRRAVEIAWHESVTLNNVLNGHSPEVDPAEVGSIYTLGPLIHNPMVLKALSERGVKVLNDEFLPVEAINSTVIIRAHGVSPAVETKFSRQGVRILDATCPHVKETQNKAYYYAEKGFKVFLAGEKDHGEIAGIRGYAEAAAESSCFVVGSALEAEEIAAEAFFEDQNVNAALIGQTTLNPAEYRAIEEAIQKYIPNLITVDSLCSATSARQKGLKELCKKVDALIIAGGKDSSNTRRLLALARELGKPAWLAETPEELPAEIWGFATVGISAGASTPDELVDMIEEKLNEKN